MRKIYYSLLAFTLMMVSAVTATAQAPKLSELTVVNDDNPYVLTLNFKEGGAYEGTPASATLDGLYDAIGTTAEEFDETSSANVWTQVKGEDGALADELKLPADASGGAWFGRYQQNEGETAYMSVPMDWGSKTTVGEGEEATDVFLNTFYLQDITVAEGVLTIGSTGQYEKQVMNPGDADYTYLYIVNGTKAAKVKVQVEIKAKMPVPFTKELDQLNIINANQPIAVDIEVVNGKKGTVEVPLADLKDYILRLIAGNNSTTVGTAPTLEDINDVLDKMTAAVSVGAEHGTTGDLVQLSEQGWFPLHDNGNNICVVANNDDPDTKYDAFELYEPSLSEEYVYSITLDLTERYLEVGDQKSVDLYLVYGSDAVKATINLTVGDPGEVPLEEMEEVGRKEAINYEGTAKPSAGSFEVDLAEVAEALGCEPDEISMNMRSEEYQFVAQGTAHNGGSWLALDGYTCVWAESATTRRMWVAPTTAGDFSKFDYDFESGNWKAGDELNTAVYFCSGSKYYLYTIHILLQQKSNDVEYNLVGTEYINYQLVPAESDWAQDSETYTLDIDYIASKIGTADYTIYTDHWNGQEEAGIDEEWYSDRTLDTRGFWFNRKKFGDDQISPTSAWAESADWAWGWGYLGNGEVGLWQRTGNNVGDTYTSNLYFANDATGDYLRYIVTVTFVTEVGPQVEDLKAYEEDQTVDATGEDFEFKINTDYLKETFGVENDEELEAVVVYVAASGGSYVEADGGLIDADGYLTSEPEDGEEVPFGNADLYVDFFDLGTISYSPVPDPAGEKKFESGIIRLAFVLDGKRIRYTVYVRSEEYVATGINTVSTAAKSGARYNVAGQKVNAAYKGIVIENGKKFLVK